MSDYIKDPDLLAQLNSPTDESGYVTDPGLLKKLNSGKPSPEDMTPFEQQQARIAEINKTPQWKRTISGIVNAPGELIKGLTPDESGRETRYSPISGYIEPAAKALVGHTAKQVGGLLQKPYGLMPGGDAVEKALTYAGIKPDELIFNATNPLIQWGNKKIEEAAGVNKPITTLAAFGPAAGAAYATRGRSLLAQGAAQGGAAYATTPLDEDPVTAATTNAAMGAAVPAIGKVATTAYNLPKIAEGYGYGTNKKFMGETPYGKSNSVKVTEADLVNRVNDGTYTPEQAAAIRRLNYEIPNPERMYQFFGEQLSNQSGLNKAIMAGGPLTDLALMGVGFHSPIFTTLAAGKFGRDLARTNKLSNAANARALPVEPINPNTTETQYRGGNGAVTTEIVPTGMEGAKFIPDTMRLSNELSEALAKQKAGPVAPEPMATTAPVVETPMAPRNTIATHLQNITDQKPGLKSEMIEANAIKVRAAELAQEQRDAGRVVLDKAANTQLARKELMDYQAEVAARRRAEYEASSEFKQKQEAEAARIAKQKQMNDEQAAARVRAKEEADRIAAEKAAYDASPEGIAAKEAQRIKDEQLRAEIKAKSNQPQPLIGPVQPKPPLSAQGQAVLKERSQAEVNQARNTLDNMLKNDKTFFEQTDMNQQMNNLRAVRQENTALNNYAKKQLGDNYQYFDKVLELNPTMKTQDVIQYMKTIGSDGIRQLLIDNGIEVAIPKAKTGLSGLKEVTGGKTGTELFEMTTGRPFKTPSDTKKGNKKK